MSPPDCEAADDGVNNFMFVSAPICVPEVEARPPPCSSLSVAISRTPVLCRLIMYNKFLSQIRKRSIFDTHGAGTESSYTEESAESTESVEYTTADGPKSDEDQKEDTGNSSTLEQEDRKETRNTGSAFKFEYRASVPAHCRIKESPLSSNAIFHQSHAGLFNLCIVVLVAVNGRLIIENLSKYGLLIGSGIWFSSRSLRDWPLLVCCLSLPVFPLFAFVTEKLAQQKYLSDPVVLFFHVIITTSVVVYPVFVILRCDSAVMSGVILMLFSCVVYLKLVSYAHTNYDLRANAKATDKGHNSSLGHPYNLSLKSLAYFMFAPTLCYQVNYPRSGCVRKSWVLVQVVKLVTFSGFIAFIIEQYINPIVKNSQHPLKGDLLYAVERVLKLSVPTLYAWLCMFYCFFHLWLNILAEVLSFGDREFYKDWWNAKTIEEYWRMWNRPVHKWMVRHVYFPCIRHGMSKEGAIVISFLVSAVFHELCIAVPCHLFKLWAFIGIMFQIPFMLVTNYLQHKFTNDMVGNMMFWFFFSILGQPMCILLYYHDVMNRKDGPD